MLSAAAVVVLGTLALGDRCAVGRSQQSTCGLEAVGGAVMPDPLGRGTWVADEERNEVTFVSNENEVLATQACDWPERLVIDQRGRAFVSCRGSGTIAVIGLDGFGAEVPVGFEPRGMAIDAETGTLYVGVSAPESIVELDTHSLRVRRTMPSKFAPDHLALAPNGLVVLARKGNGLGLMALDSEQPLLQTASLNQGSIDVILGLTGTGGLRGQQAFGPREDAWHGMALVRVESGVGVVFARMNTGSDAPVATGTYGGGGFRPPMQMQFAQLDGDNGFRASNTGKFMDVTGAAVRDGELYLSARNQRTLMKLTLSTSSTGLLQHRISMTQTSSFAVGLGAVGVAVDSRGLVRTFDSFGRVLVSYATSTDPARPGVGEVALSEGRLSPLARKGQELFHSSSSTLTNNGISCAGCHPDGREDGLVWSIDGDTRQTPLLAGRIADTAPYGWHGENPLLEGNLAQTVKRLGGGGLTSEELAALGEYVRTGLRPPPRAPLPKEEDTLVAHGKKIFEQEADCASCHDGNALTDGESYALGYGRRAPITRDGKTPGFNTPSLRFVAMSAPYLHDGSAKSLYDIVEDQHDRMGKTKALTAEQRRALVAYLRTL